MPAGLRNQISPSPVLSVTSNVSPGASAAPAFVALMYHNIFPDRSAYCDLSPSVTSYFVSSNAFESQMKALEECGGVCFSWDSVEAFYRANSSSHDEISSHKFPVLLTFDDGWGGAVEIGGPILAKHHAQAVLFVTTDFIG